MNDVLPDLLQENLLIVFCGTAASAKSAEVGAYYAGRGNKFWKTLYETRITSEQVNPTEFRIITKYHIGLTDTAKSASGNDSDLSKSDFDPISLTQKIELYKPSILAFTGKGAFGSWLGISNTTSVPYGWQDEVIGQTKIYVLTNPSGNANGYWDISVWQALAETYQQLRAKHGKYD